MLNYRDKVRAICHSLKMSPLTGVDPSRLLSISSRVKGLPSPEQINDMSRIELVNLSTRVERLIFDIDKAKNSRTLDFAIKHRIDKGLPTRLQPVLGSNSNWLEKASSEME